MANHLRIRKERIGVQAENHGRAIEAKHEKRSRRDRLWDRTDGAADVGRPVFSPPTKTVLIPDRDHTVRTWDTETGKPGKSYSADAMLLGAEFSPDSQSVLLRLASEVVLHLRRLWGFPVRLETWEDDEPLHSIEPIAA